MSTPKSYLPVYIITFKTVRLCPWLLGHLLDTKCFHKRERHSEENSGEMLRTTIHILSKKSSSPRILLWSGEEASGYQQWFCTLSSTIFYTCRSKQNLFSALSWSMSYRSSLIFCLFRYLFNISTAPSVVTQSLISTFVKAPIRSRSFLSYYDKSLQHFSGTPFFAGILYSAVFHPPIDERLTSPPRSVLVVGCTGAGLLPAWAFQTSHLIENKHLLDLETHPGQIRRHWKCLSRPSWERLLSWYTAMWYNGFRDL